MGALDAFLVDWRDFARGVHIRANGDDAWRSMTTRMGEILAKWERDGLKIDFDQHALALLLAQEVEISALREALAGGE